jgi:prefoldin alpha subunit
MSKDKKHECDETCDHEHEHKHDKQEEENRLMAQLVQQQVAEMEDQVAHIESKKLELQMVIDSINELKDKQRAEMLVPIGSGVLARAELVDTDNFLVNVGANIVVEKSGKEAQDAIKTQLGELDRAKEMFIKELEKMIM